MEYTVEAGITHHRDIRDTDLPQQFPADLVLYEEMRKTVQHPSVLPTIPLEEYLIRTEDARHTIDGHIPMLQDMEVVIPELILDEERRHRTHQSEKTDGIDRSIQRQVADDIRPLVVFPDLIA